MTFQSMQLQAKAPPSRVLSPTPVQTNLLQRKCACGGTPGVDGECTECRRKRLALQRRSTNQSGLSTVPPIVHSVPGSQGQPLDQATRNFMEPRFAHDFSRVHVHTAAPRKVQAKLSIGRSGDSYEQEADRVAEQVTAARLPQTKGSSVVLQFHPGDEGGGADFLVIAQHDLPTISPLVQREQHAWGEESLEVKSTDVRQSLSSPDAPSMIDSLEGRLSQNQGSGSPLPEPTRRFMENRFGVDFGNVRVHINVEASQMNDTLQSLAFTHGQNIYFASGMYNPGTKDGDKLLAHELTHTVQQSGGSEAAAIRSHSTTHIQRFERKPYRGPYRGKNVHTIIERILRAENPGLITEAPIPGGTTKEIALDVVGSADLYKSSDEGYVSGVRGEYPKEEHHREESQRELEYKPLKDARALSASGPAKSKPTIVAKGRRFAGEFPKSFQVADIKPLGVRKFEQGKAYIGEKAGEGTAQIGNYIEGFTKFIARARADKMVSRGTSRGDKLTGLHIPQGLDYSRFDVESSSNTPGEGNFIAGPSRYWLYEMPNLGLYLYFTLPHPQKATKYKEAIDKVFAALRKVTAGLGKGKKSIDTDPGIVTRKCRSSITGPPVRRMKRPLPARRNTRSTIQRKDGPKTDWHALGEGWEKERKQWDIECAKPFLAKEGTAIGERVAINRLLNIEGGAGSSGFSEQSKEYKSIKLWSGDKGIGLGKARFLLGGTFDKIIEFYDTIKEKFQNFHSKMQETPSGSHGWKAKVIQVLVAAIKIGFKQFLIALFRIFANCFNGVMYKVLDSFTEDINEYLAEKMEKIYTFFEGFYDKLKTEFDKRFKIYDDLIDTLKDISKWANIISGAITTIRLIIQAVSCLSPPGLGCLWGLAVQLVTDEALDIGIPLILDTQDFKEKIVQPAVQGIIKEYAGEQIQGLISFVLEQVGLSEYAKDVKECQITPTTSPAVSLWREFVGEELNRSELLKSLAPLMETASGKTPTESELIALHEEIREKNLAKDQLDNIFESSKNDHTGKFNMASIQAQLRAIFTGTGSGSMTG